MPHSLPLADAQAFFDNFTRAFAHFNGPLIAERYQAPYLAVKADGRSALYATQGEVGRYFQHIVDGYHQQGCRSCRYLDLALTEFSPHSLLASVTWELLLEGGQVHSRWRESYTLVSGPEGWRIVASMDHAFVGG
jgi:hypothetical protein